jgi:hypothetical protein
MKNRFSSLITSSCKYNHIYQPSLLRLKKTNDLQGFIELLRNNPNLNVYDEILSQVGELIKSYNPKIVYKEEELTIAAMDFLVKEQRNYSADELNDSFPRIIIDHRMKKKIINDVLENWEGFVIDSNG